MKLPDFFTPSYTISLLIIVTQEKKKKKKKRKKERVLWKFARCTQQEKNHEKNERINRASQLNKDNNKEAATWNFN